MIRRTRALYHVLQHRPPIVGRGLCFDKFLDHDVAVLIAETCRNFPLTRNRSFVRVLAPGADPVIGRNALGRVRLLGNRIAKDVLVHGISTDTLC